MEATTAVKRGAFSRRTGVELHANVPLPHVSVNTALPSCWYWLEPQQWVSPPLVSAHVWSAPAVIAVNFNVSLTLTGSA